jgi:hypothetical protein
VRVLGSVIIRFHLCIVVATVCSDQQLQLQDDG